MFEEHPVSSRTERRSLAQLGLAAQRPLPQLPSIMKIHKGGDSGAPHGNTGCTMSSCLFLVSTCNILMTVHVSGGSEISLVVCFEFISV